MAGDSVNNKDKVRGGRKREGSIGWLLGSHCRRCCYVFCRAYQYGYHIKAYIPMWYPFGLLHLTTHKGPSKIP